MATRRGRACTMQVARPRRQLRSTVLITRLDPGGATQAELEEYFQLQLAASLHDRPADPAPTRASVIGRLTRPALPQQRLAYFAARNGGGELLGVGFLVLLGEHKTDLAALNITVRPDSRRHGVGTALLRAIASAASDRRSLLIEGLAEGSAGQAWAAALGFAVVQRTVRLGLDLTTADASRWDVPAADAYHLISWTGSTPEEILGSYAAARNAIDEAPRGEMSFTEPEWTPRRVRDEEATAQARRCELRVVAAVAESDATAVAGFTYLEVHDHRPDVAIQQDTAVLQAHRGNGLGVWMKVVNLQRLVADRPEVKLVTTSNAADNVHMLRVNERVGFSVIEATQNREAQLADLARRLGL